MSFRTIIINNRCKLGYSLNYLVCRKENEESKVLIDEIKLLIINSTQVSITSSLISELIKNKVKIMFTDEKHNPIGEVMPYQNNFYSYRKIKEQINFEKDVCSNLWRCIVEEKITNQANNLKYVGKIDQYKMLIDYSQNVLDSDSSNREGHSAKVYFNALFGNDFSRDFDNNINKYLNYGYSILLATINREIKAFGYLTEIGIHHVGESNPFNLSCDFIEPLRPLVDSLVITGEINDENFRKSMTELLFMRVLYNDKTCLLENAIHLYIEDMLIYLRNKGQSEIRFIKYEL